MQRLRTSIALAVLVLRSLVEKETGRGGAVEPPTETEDLVARGYRSGRLVQVQRPGLPDANQPDIEKSDERGQETDGREITRNSGQRDTYGFCSTFDYPELGNVPCVPAFQFGNSSFGGRKTLNRDNVEATSTNNSWNGLIPLAVHAPDLRLQLSAMARRSQCTQR